MVQPSQRIRFTVPLTVTRLDISTSELTTYHASPPSVPHVMLVLVTGVADAVSVRSVTV